MAVYYKFKSARDYDSIPIEGQFISVMNLKDMIFESKHLGRGTDFDLMISNAQTDEGCFFVSKEPFFDFFVWVNVCNMLVLDSIVIGPACNVFGSV
jgi:E3 ubiquitin-protein ligase RBBP6